MPDSDILREKIIQSLVEQGFVFTDEGRIMRNESQDKNQVRSLHSHARVEKILSERSFVRSNYERLQGYFADGKAVEPFQFSPVVVPVNAGTEMSDLFRFATLLWSVPVSSGFGRRLRFLVFDSYNGKLVGLFALGDPVFNLRMRDQWIGWNSEKRKDRLYNVMDLFVLGAVPPYSELLCGKLMVMLAASRHVRTMVWQKYSGISTTICRKLKQPHLALLTTTSALGRSSLFNRIAFSGRRLIFKIGSTRGWGHFHLSNGTFRDMRTFLENIGHPICKHNRFGQGPNWKIRTIRTCLELLDLPTELLLHGLQREVYLCPLAKNCREYLNGLTDEIDYFDHDIHTFVKFFKDRWLIPRAARLPNFQAVKASEVLREIRELCD